jgi:hypothetical protein
MLARVMIGAMVVLGFGQVVFAGCTCSMPGGCGRGWSSGQVIFLGKVTADMETEAPGVKDSEAEGTRRGLDAGLTFVHVQKSKCRERL